MSTLDNVTPEEIMSELNTALTILAKTESFKMGLIDNVIAILGGVVNQVQGAIDAE